MIADITDTTPNLDTIEQLEKMLADARAGRLRTVICLSGWSDDSWTHAWLIDRRNSSRRMIGELTMMHFDMPTNQSFRDGDTVLSQAFDV